MPAAQQPGWESHPELPDIRRKLAGRAPLVDPNHTELLRLIMADVATGRMQIIQAGDCAEDPAEHSPRQLRRKVSLLHSLAGVMQTNTRRPVLCVGRIAGQFAKPRSRPTERVGNRELPAFRGILVNDREPTPGARRPDPRRLLAGHHAAATMMNFLNGDPGREPGPRLWTSHEALILDYEVPQLRRTEDGALTLASTHWPWVGERTRQPDGAHVALLAAVTNPVAAKVGPDATEDALLDLCGRLDPDREPGRLALISRMGPAIGTALPGLVTAVRRAGHPVSWLCDPMHGNTVQAPCSRKTRHVGAVLREVGEFQRIVTDRGGVAAGLHLETTPDQVTECVTSEADVDRIGDNYTTLCDPRLNPQQALSVAAAWSAGAR